MFNAVIIIDNLPSEEDPELLTEHGLSVYFETRQFDAGRRAFNRRGFGRNPVAQRGVFYFALYP